MYFRKSFSVIELLVIVVFLGVLIALAVPSFRSSKQKAQDNAAKSQLRLIQDAQKMYRLETREYASCDDNEECNSVLGLDVPLHDSIGGYWIYSVAAEEDSFCAQAVNPDGSRSWHVMDDGIDPIVGDCGAGGG
jgi:type II secretory pathway pseudopilin PulG